MNTHNDLSTGTAPAQAHKRARSASENVGTAPMRRSPRNHVQSTKKPQAGRKKKGLFKQDEPLSTSKVQQEQGDPGPSQLLDPLNGGPSSLDQATVTASAPTVLTAPASNSSQDPVPTDIPELTPEESAEVERLVQQLLTDQDVCFQRADESLAVLIHIAFRLIDEAVYKPLYDLVILPITQQSMNVSKMGVSPKKITEAKMCLKAFVLVSRQLLHQDEDTAKTVQANFIVNEIINKRDDLMMQHHLFWDILKGTRAEKKTPSPRWTPFLSPLSSTTTSLGASGSSTPASTTSAAVDRSKPKQSAAVKAKVIKRDQNICRLSGNYPHNVPESDIQLQGFTMPRPPRSLLYRSYLEVVHGIPWNPRPGYASLVERVFGVQLKGHPDCVENAVYLHPVLHNLFAAFRIWFDWSEIEQSFIMHIRPATQDLTMDILSGCLSNRTRKDFSSLEDLGLLPILPGCDIADLDPFWFTLHRVIGDVWHMAGAGEPKHLDEDDEDEPVDELHSIDGNLLYLHERLLDVQWARDHPNAWSLPQNS